jgi:hypothetical protein
MRAEHLTPLPVHKKASRKVVCEKFIIVNQEKIILKGAGGTPYVVDLAKPTYNQLHGNVKSISLSHIRMHRTVSSYEPFSQERN